MSCQIVDGIRITRMNNEQLEPELVAKQSEVSALNISKTPTA